MVILTHYRKPHYTVAYKVFQHMTQIFCLTSAKIFAHQNTPTNVKVKKKVHIMSFNL